MLAVITPLAGAVVAAAFPAAAGGGAAGGAVALEFVDAFGIVGSREAFAVTVGDWIVAVLTFVAGTAGGRVELGAALLTATRLAPLALAVELVVTKPTGGAGCALAAEATTTVDAFEPESVLVEGVVAGAADAALVAAAVTEFPGWG